MSQCFGRNVHIVLYTQRLNLKYEMVERGSTVAETKSCSRGKPHEFTLGKTNKQTSKPLFFSFFSIQKKKIVMKIPYISS